MAQDLAFSYPVMDRHGIVAFPRFSVNNGKSMDLGNDDHGLASIRRENQAVRPGVVWFGQDRLLTLGPFVFVVAW